MSFSFPRHAAISVILTSLGITPSLAAEVQDTSLRIPEELMIPVAAASSQVQEHVLQGLMHLICSWNEAAEYEFAAAAIGDPKCLLAQWGLVAAGYDGPLYDKNAYTDALQALPNLIKDQEDQYPERELAYALTAAVPTDPPTPWSEAFKTISQLYPRDPAAPLLSILFSADGSDLSGRACHWPPQAQEKLARILEASPKNPLAHFLCAYIHHTRNTITPKVLSHAQQAAELMPAYAPALHLYGYLLFRTGNYAQAEQLLTQAETAYTSWYAARNIQESHRERVLLCRMTAAYAAYAGGDRNKALALASTLVNVPVDPAAADSPASMLQLWEARTWALRIALSQDALLPEGEWKKLFSKPAQLTVNHDASNIALIACSDYYNLLAANHKGDHARAIGYLNHLHELCKKGTQTTIHRIAGTYHLRSMRLANTFLPMAQSAVYPDSADLWETPLEPNPAASTWSAGLLPPILPYPAAYISAKQAFKSGQYEECASLCHQALEQFPQHADIIKLNNAANEKLFYSTHMKASAHPFASKARLVAWSQLTPDKIAADIDFAIAEARQAIESIKQQPLDELTYENTFHQLENSAEELECAWGRVMHLNSTCDSPELRNAIAEAMPKVVAFSSSVPLDAELWNMIKTAAQQPWAKEVSPTKKRFIENTLISFKNSGADLTPEDKQTFANIENELAKLTQAYTENDLDSTNAWELIITNEADLDGLPDSIKEICKEDAQQHGYGKDGKEPAWRISLEPTSLMPVLKYVKSAYIREKAWRGLAQIGSGKFDNEALIKQILALRDQKAKLLGFKNYADLATVENMVDSGQHALDFIESLHVKIKPAFDRDMQELLQYKAAKTNTALENTIAPWDVAFWSEMRRQELYSFNEEELRPYFSIDRVMKGLMDISSTLYGIQFVERPTVFLAPGQEKSKEQEKAVEVWHPDVKFYDVIDKQTKEHLGSFYADWFPRPSKRSGAWMNSLSTGTPSHDGHINEPSMGLIAGNLTPPTGNKPALLTHYDVSTIFHEFGHLMHHLLSRVEVKSLAGTRVAMDFVELPSQLNENWTWNKQALDSFAKHYQTDETIPQELFDKMMRARNYMIGYDAMRQLAIGKLDLELHIHPDQLENKTVNEFDHIILKDYLAPLTELPPSIAHRIGHLFSHPSGYAASYYSYKWAEVLEADAFSRFEEQGVLNPEVGKAYRKSILEQGNSRPPQDLYRDFMGRDPKPEALLIKYGIEAKPKQ